METKLEFPTAEPIEESPPAQVLQPSGNGSKSGVSSSPESRQIGMGRPALQVEDLPKPETVFNVKRIGFEELVLFILGPSVIALGLSFGGLEWLFGPLNMINYGVEGIGWLLLVSAVLQVFYNVELARFTTATGEPPILAFGRLLPGPIIWIPLAIILFFLTYILGEWVILSGGSLFALLTGRAYLPEELGTVRLIGIGLMALSFLILLLGRKVERTLEAIQGVFLPYILLGLIMLTLVVVPLDFWLQSLISWVTPAAPPAGIPPAILGGMVGFTALAAGLNFIFIGYYRDKGYGMGHKAGFIAGVGSGRQEKILAVGKVFPEDEENALCWKRWFRFLVFDQWVVYFIGLLVLMLTSSILVSYLASLPGTDAPDQNSILVYAASQLGDRYGSLVSGWTLVTSFVILFSSQMVILELLSRNLTDALLAVPGRIGRLISHDARKFYYPILIGLIIMIAVLIQQVTSDRWVLIFTNLPNLAAMIFPLAMIYLNRQLPRPARITWWSYLVLLANVLFFGYFFINFVRVTILGM